MIYELTADDKFILIYELTADRTETGDHPLTPHHRVYLPVSVFSLQSCEDH